MTQEQDKEKTMDSLESNYVPKSYEDLYQAYFTPGKLAPTLCKKMLFSKQAQDWEDAVQDAYVKLFQTRILEKFDGSKANFGGMVWVACRSACCNIGRRGAKAGTEYSLVETTEEKTSGVVAEDRMFTDGGQEARLMASLGVEELRKKLSEAKGKSKAKRFQKLEDLLDLLLEGFSTEECAETLQISRASVGLWIGAMADAAK